MREKDLEDILEKYPDLIEPGLKPLGRQVVIYNRRMDLLFEDQHRNKLIIELKVGPIKDEHMGQILAYEGMILSAEDPTVRVMLIGTRVPLNIQKALDHHGIVWKELKITQLKEYLTRVDDRELLSRITEELDQSYLAKSKDRQPLLAKPTPPVNQIIPRQEIDEFTCKHCRLSLRKLREMAEVGGTKEVFTTPVRGRPMNIYEVID
jgi:endonuclease NucS-like protein